MASAAHAVHDNAWKPSRPVSVNPPSGESIVRLARTEYLEMPGLSLDAGQAARLWNLSLAATKDVLDRLRQDGFLLVTSRGQYIRA